MHFNWECHVSYPSALSHNHCKPILWVQFPSSSTGLPPSTSQISSQTSNLAIKIEWICQICRRMSHLAIKHWKYKATRRGSSSINFSLWVTTTPWGLAIMDLGQQELFLCQWPWHAKANAKVIESEGLHCKYLLLHSVEQASSSEVSQRAT